MSVFSGPQGRGAARVLRQRKRGEAEARNAATPPERRRGYRCALTESSPVALHPLPAAQRGDPAVRLAVGGRAAHQPALDSSDAAPPGQGRRGVNRQKERTS